MQVDVGEARRPNTPIRPVVGVDLGVKTALVISKGGSLDEPQHIDSPKPLKKSLKKLRRASRTLHRRKKGSNNRYKARMRVARIHQRVANIRKDFMHKVTTRLCRENQTVVIEDLNVSGMMCNQRLARAIVDVGFGMFRVFMGYKALIYSTELIVADRWFPSSKLCHVCGTKRESLSLSERVYRCDKCSSVIDRDDNAALNLEMYPRLAGNSRKATPMETITSTYRQHQYASSVIEVGTKPCVEVRTS